MWVIDGKEYTVEYIKDNPKLWGLLTSKEREEISNILRGKRLITERITDRVEVECVYCGISYTRSMDRQRRIDSTKNVSDILSKNLCVRCRSVSQRLHDMPNKMYSPNVRACQHDDCPLHFKIPNHSTKYSKCKYHEQT